MNFQIIVSTTLFIGFIFIPLCYCRWNFLDSHGHRIRHNRYWKLQYSQKDTQCESFQGIDNGEVSVTPDTLPGAIAFFRCNDGYRLRGSRRRICQANRQWSGEPASCVPESHCKTPPAVPMSESDADSGEMKFGPGTTVTYQCLQGFLSNGLSPRAICDAHGRWIGPQLRCEPISCGHPGPLSNGRFIGGEFLYMRKIVFVCNEGFKVVCDRRTMNGVSDCQVRQCQANGRWSGSQPVCKPSRCPRLRPPVNGRVSGTWTRVNRSITFSCNPGYFLVGSRTRRCQSNGRWDGFNVTCRIIKCGLPPFVPRAGVNYTDTIYGATALYRCILGSGVYGSSKTLECSSNGVWIPEPINCVRRCPREMLNRNVRHDEISKESDTDGRWNYVCPHGYMLRKPAFPYCRNGTWSISAQCQPKPCPAKLPMEANSQVSYYSLEHGSKAVYTCALGYMRTSGQDVLQCRFGSWNGTPPVCRLSTCARPPIPRNGLIYLVGIHGRWLYSEPAVRVQHDDTIEYQCRPGYTLKGRLNAVCDHGEWRPSATPDCEKIPQES